MFLQVKLSKRLSALKRIGTILNIGHFVKLVFPVFMTVLFFGLGGFLIAWQGLKQFNARQDLWQNGVTVEGKIERLIETKTVTRIQTSYGYYYEVSFKAPSSRVITFSSQYGALGGKYEIGQKVEVIYSKSAPEIAMIKSFRQVWSDIILWLGFGSFVIAGCVLSLFLILKSSPSSDEPISPITREEKQKLIDEFRKSKNYLPGQHS